MRDALLPGLFLAAAATIAAPANGAMSHVHASAALEARVTHHSNIFLRDRATAALLPIVDDWITVVRPAAEFSIGDDASILAAGLTSGVEALRFGRLREHDQETPFFNAAFSFDGPRFDASAGAAWERTALPTRDARFRTTLARRTEQTAWLDLAHDATGNSQLAAGYRLHTRRLDGSATDPGARTQLHSLHAEWRWGLTERLRLGPRLAVATHTHAGLYSIHNYTAGASFSWEASPSQTLTGRIGAGRRSSSALGRGRAFGSGEITLQQTIGPVLAAAASLSRELHPDLFGRLNIDDRASVELSWTPRDYLAASLVLTGSRLRDVSDGRRQSLTEARFSQRIRLAENTSVSLLLGRAENRANIRGFSYTSTTATLSLSQRW